MIWSFLVDLLPDETYYVENIQSTNFILGTNTKSTNLRIHKLVLFKQTTKIDTHEEKMVKSTLSAIQASLVKVVVVVMVLNATFNNISDISWWLVLLVEETRLPGENYWPVASNWRTLSHNVVSSTHCHEQVYELTTLVKECRLLWICNV